VQAEWKQLSKPDADSLKGKKFLLGYRKSESGGSAWALLKADHSPPRLYTPKDVFIVDEFRYQSLLNPVVPPPIVAGVDLEELYKKCGCQYLSDAVSKKVTYKSPALDTPRALDATRLILSRRPLITQDRRGARQKGITDAAVSALEKLRYYSLTHSR
jgi:hypothetical protein